MNMIFKDNAAAFEYACKFLDCKVAKGVVLPAIVQDGRSLFNLASSVAMQPDKTQTAVVKVASGDGGFLVVARTVGPGPALKPGDLVAWLAGAHKPALAAAAEDKRFGWVGLLVGKLRPEWDKGSWVGAERFG